MKRFVIIGLDSFGYNLLTALSERQYEIVAIDKDEEKIQDVKDKATLAVVADTRDEKVLSKFIDNAAEAVIVSLGNDIASSALTVLYLQRFGIKKIIAKAINKNHGKILRLVGATEVIYPEKDAAIALAIKLTTRNLVEHIPMADEYSIVEIAVPENLVGKKLGELKLRSKYGIEVIAIKNVLLDKFYLVPGADFKLEPDSAFVVIGKTADIENLKL